MTDQPTPHTTAASRHTAIGSISPDRLGSINRTIAKGSGPMEQHETQAGALRLVVLGAVLVLTVGLAAGWMLVAQRQLEATAELAAARDLDRAHDVFELVRGRTQDNLRAQCRVMVEDPRLKSTLATEGVDEATVADILSDLGKLRGSGFLIVLSPEGRVFAQAGAEELRGLDLSSSSVVKAAQGAREAVVGSWVIRGQLLELSVMAMRFGPTLLAYLVVGQPVNQEVLHAVADRTGVAIAIAAGADVVLASTADQDARRALGGAAAQPGVFLGRQVEAAGQAYAVAAFQLERSAQSDQRLVVVRSLASALPAVDTLTWMIRGLPILMLIAVVFSIIASRRIIVVTRSRRFR